MASHITGYKRAAKKHIIKAVCGVSMAETGSQISELYKANSIEKQIPVFTMQGGFDLKKLHGIYRFMMNVMCKFVCKGLRVKTDRTPQEEDMLDILLHGGDRVDDRNLNAVLEWYDSQS